MKLVSVNYSLSAMPSSLEEWRNGFIVELTRLLKGGAKVIVFPELFLMGLARYFQVSNAREEISVVSSYVWDDLVPEIRELMSKSNQLLVMGTAPRAVDGQYFNTAPIFHGHTLFFQDKINLTPWETDFTPGDAIQIFSFGNLKCAVIICFDIEQPLLAHALKTEGIDLLLVPSATSDKNGASRVNRCASSRAIELGAAVITSLLIGDSPSELVDHNEGYQGLYLPAQSMVHGAQESVSSYSTQETYIGTYQLDLKMMQALKHKTNETMPYFKTERLPRIKH